MDDHFHVALLGVTNMVLYVQMCLQSSSNRDVSTNFCLRDPQFAPSNLICTAALLMINKLLNHHNGVDLCPSTFVHLFPFLTNVPGTFGDRDWLHVSEISFAFFLVVNASMLKNDHTQYGIDC